MAGNPRVHINTSVNQKICLVISTTFFYHIHHLEGAVNNNNILWVIYSPFVSQQALKLKAHKMQVF